MKLRTVLLIIGIIFILSQITSAQTSKKTVKVTFIELGSVRCIPCQKMEVVLESIRKKYSKDVDVVFHDIWTEAGKPYATKYNIKSIPTQIFLDTNGKEYYRHIGFFQKKN